MVLEFLYGPFLLIMAIILTWGGRAERRQLVLALATGGAASFLIHVLYTGEPHAVIVMQAMVFPFLVLGTWLGLFLLSRIRK